MDIDLYKKKKSILKADGATAQCYARPTLFRMEENIFWLAPFYGSMIFFRILVPRDKDLPL